MKYILTILFSLALLFPAFASATETKLTSMTTGQGSNKSSVSTGVGNVYLLSAPADLSASSSSNTSINISWSGVMRADGYNLYRIKNGNAPATVIPITASTTISYSDTGLSDGSYSYQIDAFIGTKVSVKSVPTSPVVINTTTTTTTGGNVGSTGSTGGNTGGGGGGSTIVYNQADFNHDGKVDILDFNAIITNWGKTSGVTKAMGDANGDGKVDIFDFNILINNWPTA